MSVPVDSNPLLSIELVEQLAYSCWYMYLYTCICTYGDNHAYINLYLLYMYIQICIYAVHITHMYMYTYKCLNRCIYVCILTGESVGNRDAVVGKRGLENLPPVPGAVAGLTGGVKGIEGRNVKGGGVFFFF
jgi:hypothetical protein